MRKAIIVTWTESERGWGQRPDGYSLHLDREDAENYIKEYWAEEKKRNPGGEVPEEYSRPDNDGRDVYVDKPTYNKLQEAKAEGKTGIRVYSREYSLVNALLKV